MYYQKSVEQERPGSFIGYYQGLSYLKVGMEQDAQRMFDSLKKQAGKILHASKEVEFFVKFGKKQSASRKRAQAHYLLALAYLGEGKTENAAAELQQTLELDISHTWAKVT